jgi:hypothetical protein
MTETTGWTKIRDDIHSKIINGKRCEIKRIGPSWILYCDMERVGFPGAWQRLRDAKFAAHNHAEAKR